MANIAEGFERISVKEYLHFVSTAKASCAEVRSHIYVAFDAGHLSLQEFHTILNQAEEVGRLTGGLYWSIKKTINS